MYLDQCKVSREYFIEKYTQLCQKALKCTIFFPYEFTDESRRLQIYLNLKRILLKQNYLHAVSFALILEDVIMMPHNCLFKTQVILLQRNFIIQKFIFFSVWYALG